MVRKKLLNHSKRSRFKKGKERKIKNLLNKRSYISKISLIFVLSLIYLFFYLIIYIKLILKFQKRQEKYYYSQRKIEYPNYDESNLVTFKDKINWLLIHDTNRLKTKCADKILVHDYTKKKIGKDICNKIFKIYNNEEEINLNDLPEKFVLKTNHGSGYNIIVDNKNNFNIEEAKEKIKNWMTIDYGKACREFHYSFIKRKIFAEEFIGNNLKNFKFLCYNGKPKYVYVSINDNGHKYRNFYDMNWTFINFHCLSEPHPTYKYEKPKHFELMKKYAKKLSYDFKFVRVDLYELENEVRLGELTFTPMNSAFFCKNKEDEIELGKDIETKKNFYDYFIYFLGKIGYYY
jgi:hypothetical protein